MKTGPWTHLDRYRLADEFRSPAGAAKGAFVIPHPPTNVSPRQQPEQDAHDHAMREAALSDLTGSLSDAIADALKVLTLQEVTDALQKAAADVAAAAKATGQEAAS